MPTMSSINADAFLIPGVYLVGCPQLFRSLSLVELALFALVDDLQVLGNLQ
jgi:hypothetical protein